MDNREFDKRIKELLDGHLEMPDSGSWDLIASSMAKRKRATLLFRRRAIITTVAVAASLTLLLFIDGGVTTSPDSKRVTEDLLTQSVTTPVQSESTNLQSETKPSQSETTSSQSVLLPSHSAAKPAHSVTKPIQVVTKPAQSETPIAVAQKDLSVDVVEKVKIAEESKIVAEESKIATGESKTVANETKTATRRSHYIFEDDYRSRSKRRERPSIAASTNLSPSTGSNTVSLMAMSQAESGYVMSSVVSTIQKAYVPQEVISNTKFLMPVSLGVQAQLPLTTSLSVAAGVNYTLLFSHYDAISRDATRETQQTLHYIGVPVNLYYNLFNNESLRVYLSSGFALEKGLYADYKVFESGIKKTYGNSISGVQWSLNGGVGAEFMVNNSAGMYFDPSIAYYFDNNQPLSIRTAQPLQFKFELGFRFRL
ncbi:MAG: outer membrane beta-barrel protein [Bacteroidales bacterium]|nr:outer membrane beta-barrel protein [Bacteroidales bacterium]